MRHSLTSAGIAVAIFLARALPGATLPSPTMIPGKEYSDTQDVDAAQQVDPLNNLWWDGTGVVADAFDYTASGPPPADPDQVDALANGQDLLFSQLLTNQAAMIVSLQQENWLRHHNPNGAVGTWATPTQIRNPAPVEVDAVELWVQDSPPAGRGAPLLDANHYSYAGDPISPNPPGGGFPPVSIFAFLPSGPGPVVNWLGQIDNDGIFGQSTPYILHDWLRDQLNQDFNFDLTAVDVDALMVNDVDHNLVWETGDSIIFSLRPTQGHTTNLDGGELFVWQNGNPMQYLQHGGLTWDTANPVGTIFGAHTENIDALEAMFIIPEPSTAWFLLAATLCLGHPVRRGLANGAGHANAGTQRAT
ncbi:MAG: hypothetical protein AAGF97_03590 [Planctomycetota bacterium]